jgi:hypothetical protein
MGAKLPHPTRVRWINTLIGCWPLALWLPFENYRHSHLTHHRDERLTDPLDDPESYYWWREDWAALGPLGRRLVRCSPRCSAACSSGRYGQALPYGVARSAGSRGASAPPWPKSSFI